MSPIMKSRVVSCHVVLCCCRCRKTRRKSRGDSCELRWTVLCVCCTTRYIGSCTRYISMCDRIFQCCLMEVVVALNLTQSFLNSFLTFPSFLIYFPYISWTLGCHKFSKTSLQHFNKMTIKVCCGNEQLSHTWNLDFSLMFSWFQWFMRK